MHRQCPSWTRKARTERYYIRQSSLRMMSSNIINSPHVSLHLTGWRWKLVPLALSLRPLFWGKKSCPANAFWEMLGPKGAFIDSLKQAQKTKHPKYFTSRHTTEDTPGDFCVIFVVGHEIYFYFFCFTEGIKYFDLE